MVILELVRVAPSSDARLHRPFTDMTVANVGRTGLFRVIILYYDYDKEPLK